MTNDDKSAPVGMVREPKNHVIKCWTGYFDAVRAGRKTFEVRKDDRDYQEGDVVTLLDFDPATEQLTGRQEVRRIGYLARAGLIPGGYCVFALLAAPPAQPVTGCGKRTGGGLAPLKCGERTELCIDCLPAQPVREQGEAVRAGKEVVERIYRDAIEAKEMGGRILPEVVLSPSDYDAAEAYFKTQWPNGNVPRDSHGRYFLTLIDGDVAIVRQTAPQPSPAAGPGPTCATETTAKENANAHSQDIAAAEAAVRPPGAQSAIDDGLRARDMEAHVPRVRRNDDVRGSADDHVTAAPPPSTGEPAKPCACVSGLCALRAGQPTFGRRCRENVPDVPAAPLRKTPGELAREWLAWIDGAMTNSDAIAFLERAITADRGGR